ncbi:septation ring formation regulator EzrA [Salisediminibacterium selenitireducens]|uniref:Septation ring formation regulator EzrA n=1 Tax=Bacillus selenitireducens (strain ATCC 700615 / DSM 15326 / MLS10) TaxID=439292 RepID=D6XSQ2_BACIE|nr:septation ring formation regulator EzrA [Salisediminibacterium selenitireducens]ADH98838.1 Septation ring formation regulator EzrA [[Bacillus] selenitireducens MLS10]
MLNVIYIIIGLFLVITIYSAWQRRQLYKEVDRLENEKIKLMNEPVAEELKRIKGLTMSGETEERFEQWREEWDYIVTKLLPNIEERLFDIEELANKYRFISAKKKCSFVDEELSQIEGRMKEIIKEVDELVDSEEKNREEVLDVQSEFDHAMKLLMEQKASLGGAGDSLENRFRAIEENFPEFDELTEDGNYLQARELLLKTREQLREEIRLMESVPQYLVKMEKDLPRQLNDIQAGIKEMEESGFEMKHFSISWQLGELRQRLITLLPLVEKLQLNDVDGPLQRIDEEIEQIYETLEQEVLSKDACVKQLPSIEQKVDAIPERMDHLRSEIEAVKLNYQLDEEEESRALDYEKKGKELSGRFAALKDAFEEKKQSNTSLRKQLADLDETVSKLLEDTVSMQEGFADMRADEHKAAQQLAKSRRSIQASEKRIRRSNIPEIPEQVILALDDAKERVEDARKELSEVPIAMKRVNEKTEAAVKEADAVHELVDITIHHAALAERVIQYGNRFRSNNDHVQINLLKAEDRFRTGLYDEALQLSLEAVSFVEPDSAEQFQQEAYAGKESGMVHT